MAAFGYLVTWEAGCTEQAEGTVAPHREGQLQCVPPVFTQLSLPIDGRPLGPVPLLDIASPWP